MIDLRRVWLDDDACFATACTMTMAGQAEGVIPLDRRPLVGTEEAFFAQADDRCVGCAVFYHPDDDDFFWLDILYVEPASRRKGIGRTLLYAVQSAASEAGVAAIKFGTGIDNAPMQRLGRRCGFRSEHIVMRSEGRAA